MTLTTTSIVSIIVITAIVVTIFWFVAHRVKRMIQERCKICGCVFMKHYFYMNPSPNVSHVSRTGMFYDTYKYSRCKNCGSLGFRGTTRFISRAALWMKRTFRKGDFERKDDLSREAGLTGYSHPITNFTKHKNIVLH
jgi:hypothetical protein